MGLFDCCINIAISALLVSPQEHQGPTLQNRMLGPSFPSPICLWFAMMPAACSLFMLVHLVFQLITRVQRGHVQRKGNIISSEFTGPAESNDIVKVAPLL